MNATRQQTSEPTENIVERRFLTTVPDALSLPDFVQRLEAREGVLSAVPDLEHGSVKVRYDVYQLNFSEVQSLLTQLGAPPPTGIWQRWRSDWFVNMDTNIKDNALHVPACCSRPPAGAGAAKSSRSSH